MKAEVVRLLVAIALITLPAFSQDLPDIAGGHRIRPNTYGTTDQISHTLSGFAFAPLRSATYQWANGKYLTEAGFLEAPLLLPAGARVESMELEACDTSATGEVVFRLLQCPILGGGCGYGLRTSGTGTAFAGGCDLFVFTLPTPLDIDNRNNIYAAEVINNTFDGSTKFKAVRLFYRLQVSPAPATATFPNDVPTTHPFFRFVEALAAAGITAGCGPGSFCPDQSVTRGQMAVFLSAALGLHFAP